MSDKELSNRYVIKFLSEDGMSVRDISKKLKCSKSTVQKWKNQDIKDVKFLRKPGAGRKRKLNEEQLKIVESILQEDNCLGTSQLCVKVEDKVGVNLSDRTLRRYASELEFVWGKPKNRSFMTTEIKQQRLEWCLEHKNTDWKSYIFSDEKIFHYGLGPVGLRYEKNQRPIIPKIKRKGFQIWNGISYYEKFPILEVPNKMGSNEYIELLSEAFKDHFKIGMIFQQDNAPSHRSENTLEWLDYNDYDFEDFPPYSPDLNPIETLWANVNREVRLRNIKNLEELKSAVYEEMNKISRKSIQKLILSMYTRVQQCIDRNGDYTDY